MRKFLVMLFALMPIYIIGSIVGFIVLLMRMSGKIKVIGAKNLAHARPCMLIVSNHPSLLEIFLIPVLLFPKYILHPFKFLPWFTPDKRNFADKWYWAWIKARSIPVARGNGQKEAMAIRAMKRVLDDGGIILQFAEGGRTAAGTNFQYSKQGKRIRVLKKTTGWLVLRTDACILPIWVDGTDKIMPYIKGKLFTWPRFKHNITIKIGRLMRFPKVSRISDAEKITKRLTDNLLQLADQEE